MSRKRVLISYFFGDDMIPLGVSCADAFRDLGYEVYRFNSQVEGRWRINVKKRMPRQAVSLYRNLLLRLYDRMVEVIARVEGSGEVS